MSKGLPRSVSRSNRLLTRQTGPMPHWGSYNHVGDEYQIPADVWTQLTNNGLGGPKTYESEIDPLYENGIVPGVNGRLILISLRMTFYVPKDTVKPRSPERFLSLALDIGTQADPWVILPHDLPVRQKSDGPNDVNVTWFGYTLDTWEQNGAKIIAKPSAPATVSRLEYVITRM